MDTHTNRLEPWIVIPLTGFLAVSVIPGSASLVTNLIWPAVSFIDPGKVYLWITIHHVLQLAFTIFLMMCFRKSFREWGFNLNELALSLKIFGWFALIYLGVVLVKWSPAIASGTAPSLGYPLTKENMAGVLAFQMLLSGSGEEPLYRGFVMVVVGRYLKRVYRIGKLEMPASGIVATLFFMLAHIGFDVAPLRITHFSFYQQFLSFGLGLYYAMVFHRTRSLVGPIISHGYSNAITFVVLYTMVFAFA
jgi:membrane protease YdiL (CAAX protease family)